MAKMKYRVIYNPYSGSNTGLSKAEKVKDFIKDDDFKFEDMTKIADYNAFFSTFDDDENLLICGGDGTLNHFINDLGDVEIPVEVYYFATGTGNDFLNDLEKKPEDGIVNITKYLKNLPEVEVGGKTYKFINGVGYGIDGYCCEEGDKQRAQGKTEINYTSIAIKGLLFYYHPTNAKVTVDGKEYTYKKVWIAPTMKGRFYGGGMMPAPAQDRLNDDTLSLVLMYGSGKLKSLINFPKIFSGDLVKNEKICVVHKGKNIKVEFDSPTALQIDGETILGVTQYSATSDIKKTADIKK